MCVGLARFGRKTRTWYSFFNYIKHTRQRDGLGLNVLCAYPLGA